MGSNIAICLGWRTDDETHIYEGIRCYSHNKVRARQRYSNLAHVRSTSDDRGQRSVDQPSLNFSIHDVLINEPQISSEGSGWSHQALDEGGQ